MTQFYTTFTDVQLSIHSAAKIFHAATVILQIYHRDFLAVTGYQKFIYSLTQTTFARGYRPEHFLNFSVLIMEMVQVTRNLY